MQRAKTLGLLLLLFGAIPSLSKAQENFEIDAVSNAVPDSMESDLPMRFAQRPLTMPRMNVSGTFDIQVLRLSFGPFGSDTGVALGLRGSISPIENLELGLSIAGLQLAPDVDYGRAPGLFARYRFVEGNVEIAAELAMEFSSFDPFLMLVTPSIPVLIHFGETASLRTGLQLPLAFGDGAAFLYNAPTPQRESSSGAVVGDTTAVGLFIPADVSVSFMPNVFARVRAGLGIANFDDVGNSIYTPLFIGGGATLASGSKPLLDLHAEFGFPFLFAWGADDKFQSELWQLTIGSTLYLDVR